MRWIHIGEVHGELSSLGGTPRCNRGTTPLPVQWEKRQLQKGGNEWLSWVPGIQPASTHDNMPLPATSARTSTGHAQLSHQPSHYPSRPKPNSLSPARISAPPPELSMVMQKPHGHWDPLSKEFYHTQHGQLHRARHLYRITEGRRMLLCSRPQDSSMPRATACAFRESGETWVTTSACTNANGSVINIYYNIGFSQSIKVDII
ncbi:PREDICTED: uncharacterized protein LOC108447523 [Corvus brachyrhynchos]|uniref:uncharacterized protein LOC108447523 n=1 Tax=Corvus brachyrhynchos TaxID=85066 RepID=UPI0008166BE1|nr:PREDICTED: uncharacterized protein LOC108447523 [Corvus brachyrhynchos]